jgi:hypothetical protein
MKKLAFVLLLCAGSAVSQAQVSYDSITISRFLVTDELLGKNWKDTLGAGRYYNYITEEKTVYRKPLQPPPRAMGVIHPVLALAERIKKNGTEDVAKCFIPRHSLNYYKNGKLVKFLQVCFECDGLRFSDDPSKTFVRDLATREKQMAELKELFKPIESKAIENKSIYDSITIAKIKGGWNMMEPGKNELLGEKAVWSRWQPTDGAHLDIVSLTDSIKVNGTGPIGRCFFPRHRVNYYRNGKVELYLLVCFECNELQFSDDKFPDVFVKNVSTRISQMDRLRKLFAGMVSKDN